MAPRLSLLGKFVVLSLLATVLLAVVVGSALHERIERRALGNAERLTSVIGDLTVAPRLTGTQLEGELRASVLAALDAAVARVSTGEGAVRHVNLFTPDERRVYSDDRAGRVQPERARRVRGTHALPDPAVPGRRRWPDRGDAPRGLHAPAARA